MDFEHTEAIAIRYMSLLKHLSIDVKLKLISELSNSIYNAKNIEKVERDSWKDLFGVWKDMDEDVVNTIRDARFPEREVLNFDNL